MSANASVTGAVGVVGCAAGVGVWVSGTEVVAVAVVIAGADTDAGAASVVLASNTTTTEPSEILSPTLTLISLMMPACEEGTSKVALSDSSVSKESSTATVSPTLTKISITGMFL